MKPSWIRNILPLVAGLSLSVISVAHAQTPGCDLAPLELPLFGGTPVAQLVDPATPAALPDVDETGVETTLVRYVACVNTGDPARVWTMFSPAWFASNFADPSIHYLPAFEQMLAGPTVPVDVPLQLVAIDEIEQLNDGRVRVTATFASGDQVWTDTLTLVMIHGNWMIDDVILNTPAP